MPFENHTRAYLGASAPPTVSRSVCYRVRFAPCFATLAPAPSGGLPAPSYLCAVYGFRFFALRAVTYFFTKRVKEQVE